MTARSYPPPPPMPRNPAGKPGPSPKVAAQKNGSGQRKKSRLAWGLSTVLALVLGASYLGADAYDLVPGFLTLREIPRAAQFPQVKTLQTPQVQAPGPVEMQSPNQQTIAQIRDLVAEFKTDTRLGDAQVALWVGDAKGKEIVSINAQTPLIPASSTKVATAAAALEVLGANTRLKTLSAWDKTSRRLYLLGGGDMLLGAGDNQPEAVNAHGGLASLAKESLSKLNQDLAASRGNWELVVDTSYFGTETRNPSWRPEDYRWVGALQGLAIDTGRLKPGAWEFAPDPALVAGQVFAKALEAAGASKPGKIGHGAAPINHFEILSPTRSKTEIGQKLEQKNGAGKLEIVGKITSAPISQIVSETIKISDNTLAETLGRLVSLETGGAPTFAAAAQAVSKTIEKLGVNLGQSQLHGCSGLSYQTKIPARTLGQIVAKSLTDQQAGRALASYPVAAFDGTLADAYRGSEAAGILRAKTGTLTGITSLTGTVLRGQNLLVFSLILNDEKWDPGQNPVAVKQDLLVGLAGGKVNWQKPAPAPETSASPAAPPNPQASPNPQPPR